MRKKPVDLDILSALCISYSGTKKKGVRCNDVKLFDEAAVKNSIIRVTLSDEFAEILSRAYPMPFPLALFRIKSDKYPNSYYILRKIAEHKNMNLGKPNENTLSVKTLLSASPVIPTSEEVRTSNNHSIYGRIFKPFCRDVKYACEVVNLSGFYLTYKGNRIDDIPNGLKGFSFEDFQSEVYVHLPALWPDYPNKADKSR